MSETDQTALDITLEAVTSFDTGTLFALRSLAMLETQARMAYIDPHRVRECFEAAFCAEQTRHILWRGTRIGFVAVLPIEQGLLLSQLHLHPDYHNRGLGGVVLQFLFAEAIVAKLPIYVTTLKGSPAASFYERHGFIKQCEDKWDVYYVWKQSSVGADRFNA